MVDDHEKDEASRILDMARAGMAVPASAINWALGETGEFGQLSQLEQQIAIRLGMELQTA